MGLAAATAAVIKPNGRAQAGPWVRPRLEDAEAPPRAPCAASFSPAEAPQPSGAHYHTTGADGDEGDVVWVRKADCSAQDSNTLRPVLWIGQRGHVTAWEDQGRWLRETSSSAIEGKSKGGVGAQGVWGIFKFYDEKFSSTGVSFLCGSMGEEGEKFRKVKGVLSR